jgi:hypothetical protein
VKRKLKDHALFKEFLFFNSFVTIDRFHNEELLVLQNDDQIIKFVSDLFE